MGSEYEQLKKEIEKLENDKDSSAILITVNSGETKLYSYQMNFYTEIIGVLEIAKSCCISSFAKRE